MYYLGIDVGGTNLAVGVVDEELKIVAKGSVKCPAPGDGIKLADCIKEACDVACANAGITLKDVTAVGMGCPGTVNQDSGLIEYSNNLGLNNFPLKKEMEDRLGGIPFYMDNDANCAGFGEYMAGSLKGAKDSLAITLGTGVGGGVVIEGKIYSGFNYAGGELGHNVIVVNGRQCSCGRKGCWEAYSSATGLIKTTKEYMEQDKNSKMWDVVNGDIDAVNGRTVFDALDLGDETAKKVFDEYVEYLGAGLANMINTFMPEVLCVGGGISNQGERLLAPVREYVDKETYSVKSKRTKIVTAALGNDAGIIGAALLCNQ
jgi:glucokinase